MNKNAKGFTFIELIVVIAVLGIITSIATPKLASYRRLAEESICHANCKAVERLYTTVLVENDHNDTLFDQFLIENFNGVCPASGAINYEEGKVKCSLHTNDSVAVDEDDVEDKPPEEVPWL